MSGINAPAASTDLNKALRHAELEAALLNAPLGFASLAGADMVFTAANAAYLEMVGRADVVGKSWVEVFPELAGTPTEVAVRSVYEGATIRVEEFLVPFVAPDGTPRDGFYSFTLEPTRGADGAVSGFITIAVNVTELVLRRRESEALASRLRSSEDRLRSLFGAIDDGFCVLEMIYDTTGKAFDYRFLEVNEAFVAHTGLKDPVGKTALELVPDLDGSWFELYGRVAETGEPTRFENNAPALGRWFEVFASRVGDPELRQVGLVFKNVSARKQNELDREARLLAESRARREAESANRMKDDAHGLRSQRRPRKLDARRVQCAPRQAHRADRVAPRHRRADDGVPAVTKG